jgi:hypothetical protein
MERGIGPDVARLGQPCVPHTGIVSRGVCRRHPRAGAYSSESRSQRRRLRRTRARQQCSGWAPCTVARDRGPRPTTAWWLRVVEPVRRQYDTGVTSHSMHAIALRCGVKARFTLDNAHQVLY